MKPQTAATRHVRVQSIVCDKCDGEGRVRTYFYGAKPFLKVTCRTCKGVGRVVIFVRD